MCQNSLAFQHTSQRVATTRKLKLNSAWSYVLRLKFLFLFTQFRSQIPEPQHNTYCNTAFPSTLSSSKWSFPFTFLYIPHLSRARCMSLGRLMHFDYPAVTDKRHNSRSPQLSSFIHPPATSFPLRPLSTLHFKVYIRLWVHTHNNISW